MPFALELRGLHKRFVAGAGACTASAAVLRGVDLIVRAGECVAIVGARGSGKSTLLLCAAGLLTPEQGSVLWFGATCRRLASERVVRHVAQTDLLRSGCIGEPHLHLVDISPNMERAPLPRDWLAEQLARGGAVVLATRDDSLATAWASRVVELRRGMTLPAGATAWHRVAEGVPGGS